jgi:hypothetical protein
LGLKTGSCGLVIWPTKSPWQFSWIEPQNQVGYGLSVPPQNWREDKGDLEHASRSSGLLRLEASQARVSQSSLKTSGGVVQMVHVASSQRSRGDEAKDGWIDVMGCIGPFYPNFVIFIVLDHKGSLVISFPTNRTQGLIERWAFSHPSPTR